MPKMSDISPRRTTDLTRSNITVYSCHIETLVHVVIFATEITSNTGWDTTNYIKFVQVISLVKNGQISQKFSL